MKASSTCRRRPTSTPLRVITPFVRTSTFCPPAARGWMGGTDAYGHTCFASPVGVSFALEQDAARFHAAVKEVINKKQYRMRPSTFKKVWRTGLGTFTSWRGAKKEVIYSSGCPAHWWFFLAKLDNLPRQRKPEQAMTISTPSGFKHESHMGFSNGEFGFWVHFLH